MKKSVTIKKIGAYIIIVCMLMGNFSRLTPAFASNTYLEGETSSGGGDFGGASGSRKEGGSGDSLGNSRSGVELSDFEMLKGFVTPEDFDILPLEIAAWASGGLGTSGDPYQIWNAADLAQLAADVNDGEGYAGKYFKVMGDINLTSYGNWSVIGASDSTPFSGNFDGNNKTITGLNSTKSTDYVGLFGYVNANVGNVEIKNIRLTNVNIDTDVKMVGGIAGCITQTGSNAATIRNCYVIGGNVKGWVSVGGIAGQSSDAAITDCYNTANVAGEGKSMDAGVIGGIVGLAGSPGGVTMGEICGIGGIVGRTIDTTIANCYNTGNVSHSYSGDLSAGPPLRFSGSSGGTIMNCYNEGTVTGESVAGGIAGLTVGEIQNCYNEGTVTGESVVGGIAGLTAGGIQNCYNIGLVVGNDYVGGITGANGGHIEFLGEVMVFGRGTISNCYNTGNIEGSGICVGGIAGANGGHIEFLGEVMVLGGGTISNSYNIGNIESSGICVGGITGANGGHIEFLGEVVVFGGGTISNSYNTGNIESSGSYVGGIAGFSNGVESYCVSAGNVSGGDYVSGITGYSTGMVMGCFRYKHAKIGGVVRSEDTPNDVHGGIQPVMQLWTSQIYRNMGWDFVSGNVWVWDGEYTYPKLAGIKDKDGNDPQRYPFNFYFDASPDGGEFSAGSVDVIITPHVRVTDIQYADAAIATVPGAFTALSGVVSMTTPGQRYLHMKGTFDDVNPITDLLGAYIIGSSVCDVTGITTPSSATLSGTDITYIVPYDTTSQLVDVTVSTGATWKLYSDVACTTEISLATMTGLAVGANTAYIKVTAENTIATKVYTVTITRTAASSACDVLTVVTPSSAILDGTEKTIVCTVANATTSQAIDVMVSEDATWKLYSDIGCTTEISLATMTSLSIGNNVAYIKVVAEDGSANKVYTVTITREGYSLTYNANGGVGGPATVTNLVEQTGYVLDSATIPTHSKVDGKNVAFIGWTAAQDTTIYEATDSAPTTITSVNISANTEVFAVWGYATGDDPTVPDVSKAKHTLTYNANGGVGGPAAVTNLVEQTGYVLDSVTIPTHSMTDGKNVVFIGWTAAQDTTIYEATDSAPTTITSVNISANTEVFAVWGYDTDNSGTADILEGCEVISVMIPRGATLSGTNITHTVRNATTSQLIMVAVSPNATWKLYSDSDCTNEITQMNNLTVGVNTAYIRVTAQNGVTAKDYTVTITRRAPGGGGGDTPKTDACKIISVTAPENAVLNKDARTVAASLQNDITSQEISVVVSKGATWKLYSDPACVSELANNTMTNLTTGINEAYIKVTSEDASKSAVYIVVLLVHDDWAFELEKKERIQYIYGYEDGEIRFKNSITRAEAAMIFYRLCKNADKHEIAPMLFTDIQDPQEWYTQVINYMARYGVFLGYEDGEFRSGNTMTRAEFVAIVGRVERKRFKKIHHNPFTDVSDDHWAREHISSAHSNGWVSGYEDGEFRLNNPITRAEVMCIINNVSERRLDTASASKETKNKYVDLDPSYWAYDNILEAIRDN